MVLRLTLGEGRVFHRKSFAPASFSDRAWRFPAVELPWEEPGIQPGAFAPLSRPSSPIVRQPFKRRTRKKRDEELLII